MKQFLRDGNHLIRVAGLFAVGTGAFFILRAILVPAGFGLYGHYRAGALADNRKRPATFAGKPACLDCHSDIADSQKKSHHGRLSCEACHGALARHVDDPDIKPAKLPAAALCLTCHRAIVGRPASFPQVDPAKHTDGSACTTCHQPHHPEIEEGT